MLRQAVELCPPELWAEREAGEPPFWQQAYHALIITEGYASEGLGDLPAEAAIIPSGLGEGRPGAEAGGR